MADAGQKLGKKVPSLQNNIPEGFVMPTRFLPMVAGNITHAGAATRPRLPA